MDESASQPKHGQAAELLGQWRAAERDVAAARSAADVASMALAAANAAEAAAAETEEAANAAAQAVTLALRAAAKARTAASAAADAARIAMAGAEGDKVRANHEIEVAEEAEEDAHARFRDAQDRGFSADQS